MKIGVFDSGLGGLTVLSDLIKSLPKAEFVYLADTKNLPYGNKSSEELQKLAEAKVAWMKKQKVDLLVIACNTSESALLGQDFSDAFPLGVVKIIEPLANKVIEEYSQVEKIAFMSTAFTAKVNLFSKILQPIKPELKVTPLPCPDLVSAIENAASSKTIQALLENYLEPLVEENYQGLILACSHYPIIEDEIHNFLVKKNLEQILLLNPAKALVEEVLKKRIISNSFKLDCFITDAKTENRLDYFVQKLIGIKAPIHYIMPLC